jgi:hypothetical protein
LKDELQNRQSLLAKQKDQHYELKVKLQQIQSEKCSTEAKAQQVK